MRFKVIDRIVSALSGLVVLVMGIGLFVFGAGFFPFRLDVSFLDRVFPLWQRAIMVAASLLLCCVGLRGIAMLFRSSREKGFILQHTEYGDLSISMTAMENMVKKCVDTHDELKVNGTRIHHARDGVIVSIRIALANGVNIPITVSALQKQIKQYITSCSGVDVREVRVMVETNGNLTPYTGSKTPDGMMADVSAAAKAGVVVESLHEAAQSAMLGERPQTDKPERKPLHQRLFHREEKPHVVPNPPAFGPPATPATPAEPIPAQDVWTPASCPPPTEQQAAEAEEKRMETTDNIPQADETGKEEE
ncbi:MAG: alkaline shock response membrane anchor protein AmaP [Clostridiales bacterium]|nr:alkaline shock response membrane anchor protein AmaP [Clostridiales bacterium]